MKYLSKTPSSNSKPYTQPNGKTLVSNGIQPTIQVSSKSSLTHSSKTKTNT